MSFLDKINQTIGSFTGKDDEDDENNENVENTNDSDNNSIPKIAHGVSKNIESSAGSGEHQEIINGHLFVDGIDLGEVSSGALSGSEDVLSILGIPASYTIAENIFLPGDLNKVKFSSETYGFSKSEVASFYDNVVETVDYYVDLLNKRNADVAKLADHCSKLQDDLHDKELEAEVQRNSGLNIIAGGNDNNELMNAKLKIRKLKAENEELRRNNSSNEASDKVKELQKSYDEIQNALAMTQYENKKMREKLDALKERHNFRENDKDDGFEQSMNIVQNDKEDDNSSPVIKSSKQPLNAKKKLNKLQPSKKLQLSSPKKLTISKPTKLSNSSFSNVAQSSGDEQLLSSDDMFRDSVPFEGLTDDITDSVLGDDDNLTFDD